MSDTSVIPAPLAVRNLFEDLLAREVTVEPGAPMAVDDLPRVVAAVITDDQTRLAAVIGMDLSLAAHAGAALGLLPAAVADDAAEDGALEPGLADNVRELCNVLTSLLNREGAPHVRLYQVVVPGEKLPADAAAHLLALGRRLDLKVFVSRYGGGRFCLSLT
jgi:hypothetical protein